jgi:hypothetical protein
VSAQICIRQHFQGETISYTPEDMEISIKQLGYEVKTQRGKWIFVLLIIL